MDIVKVLKENSQKQFVKRILNPSQYPVLNNNDGSHSTHSMAWGEKDGKYYVFPTVLNTGDKLKRFEDDVAWDYTQKTGNYIVFDNPEDAQYFSEHYKDFWTWGEGNQ